MSNSSTSNGERVRVVFFGTPAFAVPALVTLATDQRVELVAVVTQPDRPAGRKRRLTSPPVKLAAGDLNVRVWQPPTLRDVSVQSRLSELRADVFIVAAYGRVFGRRLLELPRLGCLNLHASILPNYRGASPVTAAILNGDPATGVSLMKMDRGLDTGPVLAINDEPIKADDTTESLTERLAERAAELLDRELSSYIAGQSRPEPQGEGATVTRPLVKGDGWLDWSKPAAVLERQVRAMWPWPRAWTTASKDGDDMVIQVHAAHVADIGRGDHQQPGTVVHFGNDLVVQCGDRSLLLELVQLPGGRPQPFPVVSRAIHARPKLRLGMSSSPQPPEPLIQNVDRDGQPG